MTCVSCEKPKKVGYISLEQILESFEGVKEARKLFVTEKDKVVRIVDSLTQVYSRSTDPIIAGQLRQEIDKKRTWLVHNSDFANSMLFEGSLKQINGYVTGYAEANGYDIIFGATSDGTLMYAKSDLDLTDEVLKYMNSQYMGK